MNIFSLEVDPKFTKRLRRIDHKDQARISVWIKKNLKNTPNPRAHGKALAGGLAGYWRYRVGKYRIIAVIRDNELILLLLDVAKREDIYRP